MASGEKPVKRQYTKITRTTKEEKPLQYKRYATIVAARAIRIIQERPRDLARPPTNKLETKRTRGNNANNKLINTSE